MLLPLLIAGVPLLLADTLPAHPVVLLGEGIDEPTYVDEAVATTAPLPERPNFFSYVSQPLPATGIPGWSSHSTADPAELGFTRNELDRALASIEEEVLRGGIPGAALAVGRWDRTTLERGVGTVDRGLGAPQVDPDHTIYDLASLTKVVATTTAVMLLVEDGLLELDAPVAHYLPGFTGDGKEQVTIRHLLMHNSGLPAWAPHEAPDPAQSLQRVIAAPLSAPPGRKVEYSDVGFVVLWAAAEAAYAGSLTELLDTRIFEPLQMWFTAFNPGIECIRCAPTLDRMDYQGVVHDPIARQLGGITGNAGLFSTAHDLARFAAMLVNGGELDGVRVLKRSTIEEFTQRQPGAGTRALGWDTPDERGTGAAGVQISRAAFGHTGFTGTSLWIDPQRGTWVVLLANRTLRPSGPNRMQALRRELNDRVAVSIDLGSN